MTLQEYKKAFNNNTIENSLKKMDFLVPLIKTYFDPKFDGVPTWFAYVYLGDEQIAGSSGDDEVDSRDFMQTELWQICGFYWSDGDWNHGATGETLSEYSKRTNNIEGAI